MKLLKVLVVVLASLCVANSGAGVELDPFIDSTLLKIRAGEEISEETQARCHTLFLEWSEKTVAEHGLKWNYRLPEPIRSTYFINAMKMSVIDENNHGGWAFRSTLKKYVCEGLVKKCEESKGPLIAFAAIFPYLDNGYIEAAVDKFEILQEDEPVLAERIIKWSVKYSRKYDWLTYFYMSKGVKEKAVQVAELCAETGLQRGFEVRGDLMAKIGRYDQAEECYKKIEQRFNFNGDLVVFYKKFMDKPDCASLEYERKLADMTKRYFPDGVQSVTISELSEHPEEGVSFAGQSRVMRDYGIGRKSIVVAVDGSRVKNLEQYYFIRDMNISETEMPLILWDGQRYVEVSVVSERRRFGVAMQTYRRTSATRL